MKDHRQVISGLEIILVFMLMMMTSAAQSQTLFQDDFSKGADNWEEVWGKWEVKDGEYHQTDLLGADDAPLSLVKEDLWDDNWTEYTLEVKGKKLSGNEGIIVAFRFQTWRQNCYWWNIGGWGNTLSRVQRYINDVETHHADSNHTIETDVWYHVKIQVTEDGYTLFLNDEEVVSVEDSELTVGRIGLITYATTAVFDDVLVYGPKGQAVSPKAKLATTWARLKEFE